MTDNVQTTPPKGGFFSSEEKTVVKDAERVLKAIEAWYADHFHRAVAAGRQPIPATDKAALVQAVTEATTKE